MKTCPVCKTQVFDDMDSCFGCMYRFDEPEPPHVDRFDGAEFRPSAAARPFGEGSGEIIPKPSDALTPRSTDEVELRAQHASSSPEYTTPMTPERTSNLSPLEGWSVRLELRVPTNPAQVWSAELTPKTLFT